MSCTPVDGGLAIRVGIGRAKAYSGRWLAEGHGCLSRAKFARNAKAEGQEAGFWALDSGYWFLGSSPQHRCLSRVWAASFPAAGTQYASQRKPAPAPTKHPALKPRLPGRNRLRKVAEGHGIGLR